MNALLAACLCMPAFLMAVFSLSSLAVGLIATSTVAMLATLLLNVNRSPRIDKPYLVFMVAAVLSILLSHFLVQQPISSKQASSLAGLLVLAVSASTLLHYYFSRSARVVSRGLKWLYLFLVAIGVINIALPIKIGPYADSFRPVFPFLEPSHFALVYAQIASLALPFFKKPGRFLVVITSFLLAIGLPNATMLIVAFLLLLVTASFRFLLFSFLIIAPAIRFVMTATSDLFVYFTDRLSSSGAENLSRLVYIQGWESLGSAVTVSNGIGIGFQNLGNEPPGPATAILARLMDDHTLNRADGGFLFAKLGGEFGAVGIMTALSLLALAIWSFFRLRRELRHTLNAETALALIPLCSTYIFIIEILVRGVGYFSPSLIVAIYFIPLSVRVLRNKASIRRAPGKPDRELVKLKTELG
jgi:hypothetical protein